MDFRPQVCGDSHTLKWYFGKAVPRLWEFEGHRPHLDVQCVRGSFPPSPWCDSHKVNAADVSRTQSRHDALRLEDLTTGERKGQKARDSNAVEKDLRVMPCV